MTWLKKLVILAYLVVLGFSYLQIVWFFGIPSFGGIILTPSAHPYVPPLSLVITKPSNVCNGWSVYFLDAHLGPFPIKIPVMHYFADGYELFNGRAIFTDNVIENVINYFHAMIDPKWVIVKSNKQCVAEVVAVVPAPLVILTFIALMIPIYYNHRRIW